MNEKQPLKGGFQNENQSQESFKFDFGNNETEVVPKFGKKTSPKQQQVDKNAPELFLGSAKIESGNREIELQLSVPKLDLEPVIQNKSNTIVPAEESVKQVQLFQSKRTKIIDEPVKELALKNAEKPKRESKSHKKSKKDKSKKEKRSKNESLPVNQNNEMV